MPTDFELLTIDQALICTAPKHYLTKNIEGTPSELASQGHIPPEKIGIKSRCELAQERAKAKLEAAAAAKQKRRRKRR